MRASSPITRNLSGSCLRHTKGQSKLGGPALQAAGGRILARGNPVHTCENGLSQRCVVIEFDSVAAANAAHDSPGYKAALDALGNGAERDIRIMEGA